MGEIASHLPADEIERISRIQPRGAFSEAYQKAKRKSNQLDDRNDMPLFAVAEA